MFSERGISGEEMGLGTHFFSTSCLVKTSKHLSGKMETLSKDVSWYASQPLFQNKSSLRGISRKDAQTSLENSTNLLPPSQNMFSARTIFGEENQTSSKSGACYTS